jgi:hypothetical protein
MMIKRNLTLPSALLLTLGLVAGCGPKTPPTPANVGSAPPAGSSSGQAQTAPSGDTSTASNTPIQDSVKKLLTEQDESDHPVIPKGTKLLSADFKDGVATLDFSSEFNALADHGDTVESKAQKALRHALTDIPGVDKMRVTVEGKPFESQATDWNTPFPVRDVADDSEVREMPASDRGGDKQ